MVRLAWIDGVKEVTCLPKIHDMIPKLDDLWNALHCREKLDGCVAFLRGL
jgi:hypothetical protein